MGKIVRPKPGLITIKDTGSMRPLVVGDTPAMLRESKIEDVKPGQIALFEQTARGALTAHTVTAVKKAGNGKTYLITTGTGNHGVRDPINVSEKDFVGIVELLKKNQ